MTCCKRFPAKRSRGRLRRANARWSRSEVTVRAVWHACPEEVFVPLAAVCAPHSPLMFKGPASLETEARVKAAFSDLAAWILDYKPDCIIQFAPDHFNGFFYDLMPPFCVGAGAVSLGDWGGGTGPLDGPEKTAIELVEHVRAEDFDVPVSYRIPVNHGSVQICEPALPDFK